MRVRDTARVLLLDPQRRILLMRGRLAGAPDDARFWFTIGGGVEPGETVEQAAAREVLEETGIADVRLGPVVWLREGVVPHMETGEPLLFREQYLVATTGGGEPDRSGWNDLERRLVDAIRWWTLAEIAGSRERIYPEGLAGLLPEILAGQYPESPIWIGDPPTGA
jgi:8-oxo-dGTP pyrophosphatase MutT (NUDIX family)